MAGFLVKSPLATGLRRESNSVVEEVPVFLPFRIRFRKSTTSGAETLLPRPLRIPWRLEGTAQSDPESPLAPVSIAIKL